MAWFGKKQDDAMTEWSSTHQGDAAVDGINFASYDLQGLGEDIRSIIDVPGAIAQGTKWAIGIPVVVSIAAWIGFAGTMSNWLLVPFLLVVFALAMLPAMALGVYAVSRKRLNLVADASGRVVTVLGEMHGDVVQLRDGHADTSVQQVAIGLFQNAIFPLLTGMAAGSGGALSFVTSRAMKVPMELIERSVVGAIKLMPDHRIGHIANSAIDQLPDLSSELSALTDVYDGIWSKIESVTAAVSQKSLASIIGVSVVAAIPLAVWLLIGVVAR